LTEKHEGEDDISLILSDIGILRDEPEVARGVDCDDTPEEIDSDCESDQEGSHEAQKSSECQIFKHFFDYKIYSQFKFQPQNLDKAIADEISDS
jgi:hypothetical protein